MAKLTTTDLTSLANETSAVNTINANFALVETALDNTLSRDGTATNTMGADLDMNGNDLLNVGAITFGASGTSITDSLIGTPDTTTDNAIVRWDGTTGTAIQDSGWILSDADLLTAGGSLNMSSNSLSGVTAMAMTGSGALTNVGAVTGTDGVMSRMEMRDMSETAYDNGNWTGNVTMDYTNGSYQYAVLTGNTTVTSVSNWPATGKAGSMTLEVSQDGTGGYTLALTGVEWAGGTAPTITATASATDVLVLFTRDAGTTVRGVVSAQDFS